MQSSSLQPLTSWWSLDSDDYRIYSKNHHRLYPPPCAKLSHLLSNSPKSFSSNIFALLYWRSYIFWRFLYPQCLCQLCWLWQLSQCTEKHVAEFQATILAETSIPTVQLQVHHLRQCDHVKPQYICRWARIKAKLYSYSCCWSIIKWLIQMTHFGAMKKSQTYHWLTFLLFCYMTQLHFHMTCLLFMLFPF